MQLLDRGFHGALKKYYTSECEKWLRNHPGRVMTTFQFTFIFAPAFYKAATEDCGVKSFRSTGIWPWNPDVFTDDEFMASTVTERENPECCDPIEIEDDDISTQIPEDVPVEAAAIGSSQTLELTSPKIPVDCMSPTPAVSFVESVKTTSNQLKKVFSTETMAGTSKPSSSSQSSD